MYHDQLSLWKDLIAQGLREDGWPWDWTSLGTRQNPSHKLEAKVVGKSPGVWAAESLVKAMEQSAHSIQAKSLLKDGEKYKAGTELVILTGSAGELLALERPFLNLAAYIGGIATATSLVVETVAKTCPNRPPRVTLTRKTLPGYRDIAIHGVRIGGGHPHRVSLSGGVLIKENHIMAAGGIVQAIRGAREVAPHGLKIEVEVRNEKELKEAVFASADGVLLDNFSPAEVRSALDFLKTHPVKPFVEVSGGINEKTVASYAIEGIDILSLGSLTHSVRCVDLSLLVK